MRSDSTHRQITSAVAGGWAEGGSFIGSILSGTLLGHFADRWLGTEPWILLIGFGLGAYSGFLRLWDMSKRAEGPVRDR
jgi:ATP synthase protein I